MFKMSLVLSRVIAIINVWAMPTMALAEWREAFRVSETSNDPLRVTSESMDAATSLTWAAKGLALVAATLLLIMCAKRLHREDYYGALLTFVGALIAGASPYLSSALFLG